MTERDLPRVIAAAHEAGRRSRDAEFCAVVEQRQEAQGRHNVEVNALAAKLKAEAERAEAAERGVWEVKGVLGLQAGGLGLSLADEARRQIEQARAEGYERGKAERRESLMTTIDREGRIGGDARKLRAALDELAGDDNADR